MTLEQLKLNVTIRQCDGVKIVKNGEKTVLTGRFIPIKQRFKVETVETVESKESAAYDCLFAKFLRIANKHCPRSSVVVHENTWK